MTGLPVPGGRGGSLPRRDPAGRRAHQADRLADLLAAAMVPVAQRAERAASTSATPEQVDVVIELEAMTREVAAHCRRVLQGEASDWTLIAERLGHATARARSVVMIDPVDTYHTDGR